MVRVAHGYDVTGVNELIQRLVDQVLRLVSGQLGYPAYISINYVIAKLETFCYSIIT